MIIDEKAARAVHERVAQTLAYASANFGYVKPNRSAPVAVAATPKPPASAPATPPPITPAALAKAAERAELVRLTANALAKLDAQAEARASWKKVIAAHNGSKAAQTEPARADPHGWFAIAARHNAEQRRHGDDVSDGDAKASRNHGWGRFLP